MLFLTTLQMDWYYLTAHTLNQLQVINVTMVTYWMDRSIEHVKIMACGVGGSHPASVSQGLLS